MTKQIPSPSQLLRVRYVTDGHFVCLFFFTFLIVGLPWILDSAQTPHGTLHRIRGTPSPNVVYGNPDIEFGTLDFPSACLICNVPWEEGAVRRDKSGFNLKARWKAVVALESSMHGQVRLSVVCGDAPNTDQQSLQVLGPNRMRADDTRVHTPYVMIAFLG